MPWRDRGRWPVRPIISEQTLRGSWRRRSTSCSVTTLQEGGVHIARAQEAGVVAGARPGGDEERAEWARLPRVNSLGQIMKEIYEARDTHMGVSSQHGNAAPSSRGGSWYPEG